MKESNLKSLWPEIDSYEAAVYVMRCGAAVAALNCVITVVLVIAALNGNPILGINAWNSIDALLFAIVSWRMFNLSLPWALVALVAFVAGRLVMFYGQGFSVTGIVVGGLFFLAYFHAVRAGFVIRSMSAPAQEIQPFHYPAPTDRD
jgi:hypothetical protein